MAADKEAPYFHALVMAGGSGTRFWPFSRRTRPKQLLPLLEGRTLLSRTLDRLGDLPATAWIVTGPDLEAATREALPGFSKDRLLVEPEPRDTAPCVCFAVARILGSAGREAVTVFLPADHVIRPLEAFHRSLSAAVDRARKGHALVTLGIEPSRPATGYGYIKTGAELDPGTGHRVLSVERFVEKPDHETALGFLADGGYLWNSGIFAWQIGTLLEEMQSLAPELHAGTIAMSESFQQGRNDRAAEVFRRLPRTSLDYALLEKSRVVEVLPAEFQWDDVGSFDALLPYLPPDENDNRRLLADGCRTMIRDGSGNLVLGRGGHLLAVLGLSDLVLVHTPDATLVCPRHRVEEVKKLVQEDLGEDSEFR